MGLFGAVAATIATRNNQELQDLFKDGAAMDYSFFSNSTLPQFVRHFLLKGTLQDVEVFQKRLRRLLGDATFLEAFMHSGMLQSQKSDQASNRLLAVSARKAHSIKTSLFLSIGLAALSVYLILL